MNIALFDKFLSSFKNKANGVLGLNSAGDAVGNFIPRTGLLADLQALAGTQGEIASATDFPAIVEFTGTAGQAKTIFPTATGLRAAVVPTIPGFIGANTTVTIGTGKNFADLDLFKAFIEQCVVDESATITLMFDAGTFAAPFTTAGKTWPHIALCSDQTAGSETITGVAVSATGAAGAWTITLSKTGLAAAAGVTATDASRALAIIDGTAGTNPDNAVGVYAGITYVNADTLSVASFSTLTAMPTVSPTCTIYVPKTTLDTSAWAAGAKFRSITFGAANYAPVAITVTSSGFKDQIVKSGNGGANLLLSSEFWATNCTIDVQGVFCWAFFPEQCFLRDSNSGGFKLITDGFNPVGCDMLLGSGFFMDMGYGTTKYAAEASKVVFSAHTIINTLADGQLEPYNGSFWQVGSMTINGTAVTGANLLNYTTLTPGALSATGGFIYFG